MRYVRQKVQRTNFPPPLYNKLKFKSTTLYTYIHTNTHTHTHVDSNAAVIYGVYVAQIYSVLRICGIE